MQARRIDVHCHAVPNAYRSALSARNSMFLRVPDWSPAAMLALMDKYDIAASIPSLSVPGTHLGDDAAALDLARACNDEMAENAERWPGRFGGFAALPLPDVEAACGEAIRALDHLKLDGIGLFTNYQGRYLGDAAFDPLLQVLDARDTVVFIHPIASLDSPNGLDLPPFAIEYPFDTTRAAVSLILSGALDRFPRIRFILSHAGGTLPFLSWRISTLSERLLAQPPLVQKSAWPLLRGDYGPVTADAVMSRIRRFWFDIANASGPQTLRCLDLVADADKILFGSDWPYVPDQSVDDVIEGLSSASGHDPVRQSAVERENATALFPRFA